MTGGSFISPTASSRDSRPRQRLDLGLRSRLFFGGGELLDPGLHDGGILFSPSLPPTPHPLYPSERGGTEHLQGCGNIRLHPPCIAASGAGGRVPLAGARVMPPSVYQRPACGCSVQAGVSRGRTCITETPVGGGFRRLELANRSPALPQFKPANAHRRPAPRPHTWDLRYSSLHSLSAGLHFQSSGLQLALSSPFPRLKLGALPG